MAADGLSPVERHNRLEELFSTPPGLGKLSAVNHSIVGLRFIYTSGAMFLIGGLLAMLMRAQLATADSAFLGHEAYNQVFTAHGTIMMFLFAIPMIEGITLYLLPKVLGARDLAFPRLSAFVSMTQYDATFDGLGVVVAFPPESTREHLGEIVSRHGIRQLRIAETEKYAHVTYFMNGGDEQVCEAKHGSSPRVHKGALRGAPPPLE
jgi:hypothetical protein